jgi:transposase
MAKKNLTGRLPHAAFRVATVIKESVDGVLSYSDIKRLAGVSVSTLWRAVRILKERGLLTVSKAGTTNKYKIASQNEWEAK